MITLYSGTPGSGKSYHAAKDVYKRFEIGGGLIANFPVQRPDKLKPKKELRLSYWDNSEITPQRLTQYALKYHEMGKEGQTLLIVDEAQVLWNSREFQSKGRQDWISFFSQHRKLGYNVLLIAQNDRMLDRQIRFVIENEVRHRKLDNYGFGGKLLKLMTGNTTWFIAIEYWYGGNKLQLGRELIRYNKKYAAIYDSYRMFDDFAGKNVLMQADNSHNEERSAADLRLETVNPVRSKLMTCKNKKLSPEAAASNVNFGKVVGSELAGGSFGHARGLAGAYSSRRTASGRAEDLGGDTTTPPLGVTCDL